MGDLTAPPELSVKISDGAIAFLAIIAVLLVASIVYLCLAKMRNKEKGIEKSYIGTIAIIFILVTILIFTTIMLFK